MQLAKINQPVFKETSSINTWPELALTGAIALSAFATLFNSNNKLAFFSNVALLAASTTGLLGLVSYRNANTVDKIQDALNSLFQDAKTGFETLVAELKA